MTEQLIRRRRRLPATGVAVLLSLMVVSCSPNSTVAVPDPSPSAAGDLQQRLESQPAVVTHSGAMVVSLIANLPYGHERDGSLSFRPRPKGRLSRTGLIQVPREALREAGVYLAVQDHNHDLAHLARVGREPFLVSERNSGGVIRFNIQPAGSWVVSTEVPFLRDGWLRFFEVDNMGMVSAVLFAFPLGSEPDRLPRVDLRREP